MEAAMRDRSPELQAHDYEQINRVLNDAESALLSLAATHRLLGTKIDRWRWDIPEVVISWGDPSVEIGRNIRVHVQKANPFMFTCTFDVNAWRDMHFVGNQILRHWKNQNAGEIEVANAVEVNDERLQRLSQQAERAYLIVSEWTSEDLSNQGGVLLPQDS